MNVLGEDPSIANLVNKGPEASTVSSERGLTI